jgi:hypothetical protein
MKTSEQQAKTLLEGGTLSDYKIILYKVPCGPSVQKCKFDLKVFKTF